MVETMRWLLEGLPWVEYRTRVDVLGESESAPAVRSARERMLAHPQLRSLLDEVSRWPWPSLKRHNDAAHPVHKLVFLADLGLRAGDAEADAIAVRLLEQAAPEGAFQVVVNVHPRYGGTGTDQWAWALCDAPSILYALARMGFQGDSRVQGAARHLAGLLRENGWPCAVSASMGKFRGPGRKGDPCPYATLVCLKALAELPGWRESDACRIGAEALLRLWETRKARKPYLFGMGTDFAKLKAPLIWYDILHLLEVLTRFAWLRDDPRLQEMLARVEAKADDQGRFTPESVYRAWSDWDFGQKREPSPGLTLLAARTLRRTRQGADDETR